MDHRMINVGFGNVVPARRVLAVVNPKSSPIKKLKDEAREEKRLIDVTEGRRTRSVIILDSNHVVLSSVQPETITMRYMASSMAAAEPEAAGTPAPRKGKGNK